MASGVVKGPLGVASDNPPELDTCFTLDGAYGASSLCVSTGCVTGAWIPCVSHT